jgi:hypothetical protein
VGILLWLSISYGIRLASSGLDSSNISPLRHGEP